jgi:hypothetical protein
VCADGKGVAGGGEDAEGCRHVVGEKQDEDKINHLAMQIRLQVFRVNSLHTFQSQGVRGTCRGGLGGRVGGVGVGQPNSLL